MDQTPDFERVRKTLLLQGEPDRVPIMEQTVDREVKKRFIGRALTIVEDEVEFWMAAGYDYVPVAVGLRLAVRIPTSVAHRGMSITDFSKATKVVRARYSMSGDVETERGWAEEGTGIIAGRAEFDAVQWPDPDALDYSAFEEVGRHLPPGGKVIGCVGYVFSTVNRLMGFQNFCEKLIEEPDLVARVFDRVGQIQLRVFENVVKMDLVGATWHSDDVAYRSGLMVAPRHLRKYMWPWYREMCRISREMGKPIIFHSDGNVDEALDDVVDCGFTSLHPIEPGAMDIVGVKRRHGDRLSLIGNIDLSYTLTRGTPEEVESEVRQRIRELAPGGGYAVGSGNSVPEYVPLENFNAMREAAFKYGKYPLS